MTAREQAVGRHVARAGPPQGPEPVGLSKKP